MQFTCSSFNEIPGHQREPGLSVIIKLSLLLKHIKALQEHGISIL